MRILFSIFLAVSVNLANATVKDCGWLTIEDINVIAEHAYPEHVSHYVVIRPGADRSWQCQDYDFFYLEMSDPAFGYILTMAKDAHNLGKKVRIGVHSTQGIYNGYQKIMFLNI